MSAVAAAHVCDAVEEGGEAETDLDGCRRGVTAGCMAVVGQEGWSGKVEVG